MLHCLSFKSSSAATSASSLPTSPNATIDLRNSPPHAEATSAAGTSATSAQLSPAVNLRREYTFAFQTDSYKEIWSRLEDGQFDFCMDSNDGGDVHRDLLDQLLRPDRECVKEALRHTRDNAFTRLISTCFDQCEKTTLLCLLLRRSVSRARDLYRSFHDLLDVLPLDLDTLTRAQCESAFDIFLHFDQFNNPFPCPDSHNFQETRRCFSQLRQQLNRRIDKSHSRVRLFRRTNVGCVVCAIGSVVAVAISAVAIATHAIVAIVACPICTATYLPRNFTKKERAHVKKLEAASRGAFVLKGDLGTIDCLVARLYADIEGDKNLIRLGLKSGRDDHTIVEVLKQVRKNHLDFVDHLSVLEEHICLCFNYVNKARALLLQEIRQYQSSSS